MPPILLILALLGPAILTLAFDSRLRRRP